MADIIFTNRVGETLDRVVADLYPASVVMLADTNTARCVVPRLRETSAAAAQAPLITVGAGEACKSLDSLSAVWSRLGTLGATRKSLLVNVGGGIVTDMGGFAASTFKRGMAFVNIPTTLLSAVDASSGGKTGINFGGLKNEIGVFSTPESVIVSTCFFDTLPHHELLSGYAEMIKHALLDSEAMFGRLTASTPDSHDADTLLGLIRESVAVKQRFVAADPLDTGVRHALNLGHTFAHAFESLAMSRGAELSHGYAVARGLVAALVLSHMQAGMDTAPLYRLAAYVRENYGAPAVTCDDYEALLGFMRHDKKNDTTADIRFTLLGRVGEPLVKQPVPPPAITAALDIWRDLLQ